MTVCIAAICNVAPDRPPVIVAASDRMITIGDIEYEPEQTKLVQLASQTVVLLAGDMQVHAAVVPATFQQLMTNPPPSLLVKDIAEFYAREFAMYRLRLAERTILTPLGLDINTWVSRQQEMIPNVATDLLQDLQRHRLDSEAIIAGIDQTGAHLYMIHDPGIATCFDTSCFVAIGSGSRLAESQFMIERFDKKWPFPDALFLAFSAKARAETAAGVGNETDLTIIRPGGTYQANESDLRAIRTIFNARRARDRRADDDSRRKVQVYIQQAEAKAKAASQIASVGDQGPGETQTAAKPQFEES